MLNVWYLADAHGALEVDAPVGAPLLRQEPQDRLVVLLTRFRVQDIGCCGSGPGQFRVQNTGFRIRDMGCWVYVHAKRL